MLTFIVTHLLIRCSLRLITIFHNPGIKEILHSDVLLICKTCMCGRQDLQSAAAQGTRIVGGMESEANEFPWKVTIFPVMKTATPQMRCTGQVSLEKTGADHKCGASLISPFHLLTAAHCVIDPGEELISDLVITLETGWDVHRAPSMMTAVLGAHDL